jgi:hypothetical protein
MLSVRYLCLNRVPLSATTEVVLVLSVPLPRARRTILFHIEQSSCCSPDNCIVYLELAVRLEDYTIVRILGVLRWEIRVKELASSLDLRGKLLCSHTTDGPESHDTKLGRH